MPAILLAVCLAAWAQDKDKPNFTGKWALDAAKSDFGVLQGPESQVHVMDHQEPNLAVKTTTKTAQGETNLERKLTTDGKQNANSTAQGEIKSTSKWDGRKLVTEMKITTPNGEIEIRDVYELSEDGKTLLIHRDLKAPQGETTQRLQFAKQ
jgi:hypothetical protein